MSKAKRVDERRRSEEDLLNVAFIIEEDKGPRRRRWSKVHVLDTGFLWTDGNDEKEKSALIFDIRSDQNNSSPPKLRKRATKTLTQEEIIKIYTTSNNTTKKKRSNLETIFENRSETSKRRFKRSINFTDPYSDSKMKMRHEKAKRRYSLWRHELQHDFVQMKLQSVEQ